MRMMISIVGGVIIGFGIVQLMFLSIEHFGVWGWFMLIPILFISAILVLLLVCLPLYFEERKLIKKHQKGRATPAGK